MIFASGDHPKVEIRLLERLNEAARQYQSHFTFIFQNSRDHVELLCQLFFMIRKTQMHRYTVNPNIFLSCKTYRQAGIFPAAHAAVSRHPNVSGQKVLRD